MIYYCKSKTLLYFLVVTSKQNQINGLHYNKFLSDDFVLQSGLLLTYFYF